MAKKVGEILVDAGLIDERQLELALAEQKRVGSRLGTILADLGFTTEDAVSRALATQSGVNHCDVDSIALDPAALEMIPEAMARRLDALPIRIESETLIVAMSNPTDIVAIDEIQQCADLFVKVMSATHRQLVMAIDRGYRAAGTGDNALDRLAEEALAELEAGDDAVTRGAVISLVDELMNLAVRRDATDVHFEPDKRVVRVRFRIDGDLVQGPTFDRRLAAPLVARIKVLADLDISETRVPQDGKIRFPVENRIVDLRISTFPSVRGESVVIRILDKERQNFALDQLGLPDEAVARLRKQAARPNGLILAAGPTGSGKSTTLYAMLRTIDAARRKIITVEDPVEYEVPLVTQCQVNTKAGVTFAAGLRAILRHDPDVILVGEMRDTETAQMAMRAALTGHLVLSTLHTNDAVRTMTRIIDMGIDAYIAGSCLSAIIAQRLVRTVCVSCVHPYEPTPDELGAVGLAGDTKGRFMRGKGCERCNGTGARGREAIFELLEVTPRIAQLIASHASAGELEAAAVEEGLVPFREMAQRRAAEGHIPLEEVARVTSEY